LEWAFRRLLATDQKIALIAVEAGFADHAHFCRLFKERYGMSPSEHRNTHGTVS
jgi:AraC-like DNA-binding protein